jgi:flagellar hook-basal body complex protein FliE
MEGITSINLSLPMSGLTPGAGAADREESTFWGMLQEALGSVNRLQQEADRAALDFAGGDLDNLHQVLIKTEEARLALQLTTQVVNKVVQAYQDISRMQI